jgi:acetyl-CoA synthetase
MYVDTISKPSSRWRIVPNMPDYGRARRTFTWDTARAELDGLPGGGLNMAYEAVDRHLRRGRGARTALRFIDRAGDCHAVSYAQLSRQSNRFANLLTGLGVAPGSTVALLMGRRPELHVCALGALKAQAIVCPLFSAFGPEPIRARLVPAHARVLVTTADLYARKVEALRTELPELAHVLLVDAVDAVLPGAVALESALEGESPEFTVAPTDPDTPALLHFTSGTTGRPKGALHAHDAVVAHHATARLALDLHPEDVFWCTADPGWVTGISYGVIAPLTVGATLVLDEGEFDAERWYGILRDQQVSVWYTSPTAVRMMMRVGARTARRYDLPALRFIASVGEPLPADAVRWGVKAFGLPIHDNWWQTETGGIMIANFAATDIRPGSMGRPMPGIEAAIVLRTPQGATPLAEPDTIGELALRAGWPSMFRAYLDDPQRYSECFRDGWYLSGDLARVDSDGYFWFVGRADDVIKSAGHLIGPFEVESALLRHPAVADAAVIGKPDPVMGEMVKAYVVVKAGIAADAALQRELLGHARSLLGPAVAPREIEFAAELPKTRSGKTVRRLLKACEPGPPHGGEQ